MTASSELTGVLLAGGQARRMGGGDKCLLPLAGQTLLQRAIERAKPQVSQLILNANGNVLRFTRSGLPVVPDEFSDFPGPLAGIHAALEWMRRNRPEDEWLASFASDTPFFPRDLVARLRDAAAQTEGARLAVAHANGQMQPVFALWHRSLRNDLEETLGRDGTPRLQDWISAHRPVTVEFTAGGYDPFHNINTPQDLYAAEDMLSQVE